MLIEVRIMVTLRGLIRKGCKRACLRPGNVLYLNPVVVTWFLHTHTHTLKFIELGV